MLQEQNQIYELLPDGLLLHDQVKEEQRDIFQVQIQVGPEKIPKVKYINNTFKKMFLKQDDDDILDLK